MLWTLIWAYVQSLQSCPTLCDPMDYRPPGSFVHGIIRNEYWRGCHFLLQGVFPTQGLNPCPLCLLHWQAGSLTTVPPGEPTVGQNHLTQGLFYNKVLNKYYIGSKNKMIIWLHDALKCIGCLSYAPMADWETITPLISRLGEKKSRFKVQHIVSTEA